MEIFNLFGSVFLKSDEAKKGLEGIDEQVSQTNGRLSGMMKTAGKWGATLVNAATAVGAGMFDLTTKATQAANKIAVSAEKAGLSTKAYQELSYWAQQNSLSHSSFDHVVEHLNQSVGRAVDGNEEYAKAFRGLGVELEAGGGKMRATEDIMNDTIGALMEIEDSSLRSAAASDLFGSKLASDLMPVLADSSLSIKEATERAHELGLVMGEDQIIAAQKFQGAWSDVKETMSMVGIQIGLALMPIFQRFLDWVMEYMPMIQNVFQEVLSVVNTVVEGLVDFIGGALDWISDLFRSNGDFILSTTRVIYDQVKEFIQQSLIWLQTLWEGHGQGVIDTVQSFLSIVKDYFLFVLDTMLLIWDEHGETAVNTVMGFLDSIKDLFMSIFEVIEPFVQEKLEQIRKFWEENGEQVMQTVQDAFSFIYDNIFAIITAVVEFLGEKLDQISEFWEENGEQIMQAVDNAFSFILGIIEPILNSIWALMEFIWPAVQYLIQTTWDAIKGVINGALDFIMGLVDVFVGLFTGDFSKMWDGVKQMFSGALEFLWNAIQLYFVGRIVGVARTFADMLRNVIINLWTGIRTLFTNALNAIRTNVSNILTSIRTNFSDIFNGLKSIVTTAFSNVRTAVKDGMDKALTSVTDFLQKFKDAGKNIVTSIADGIKNAVGVVTDAIGDVVGKVRDFLPFSPAKEGPLKDIHRLNFGGPIADSIERDLPDVQGAMAHMLHVPGIEVDGADGAISASEANDSMRGLFDGATINVRSEEDIERLALKIEQLKEERRRGRGKSR